MQKRYCALRVSRSIAKFGKMVQMEDANVSTGFEDSRAGTRTWHFVVGVFALLAALIGIGAISFAAFQRAVDIERTRTEAVARTSEGFESLVAAERVINALQEAERSQRGFVLTENPVFLEPYEAAIARSSSVLDELQRRIGEGDERQTARFVVLRRLITLKLEEMARSVEMTRRGRMEAARIDVASGYGRRLMDEIQAMMNEIVEEQRAVLDRRQQEVVKRDQLGAQSLYRLAALGVALLVAALISMIALAYMVYRTKLALEREEAGEIRRNVLEAAVAARTHELTQANVALRAEIASREAAENRLRQAQRMEAVGQLTGGIAHDFNNMLAVIISSLDLLKRRISADDARVVKLIDNAREGANRAASLTARLLAFSRRQSLNPQTVDVNTLMTGVVELIGRTLGERISVETKFGDNIPPVFVDPGELENVIINLAANARDAMPDGGALMIETKRYVPDGEPLSEGETASAYALISVTDTGQGMPPEVAERVFEPFFTTKAVGKGTGLGLSQVHGFVHQSGGHISLESTPGEGTRVDIYLPVQIIGRVVASAPRAEGPLARGSADETILVVEDEDQLRMVTVENLRELGYTVRHAENGKEALEILDEHPGIRLLFTDIVMPGMYGDELAREALSRWPDLGLLYTSGFARTGVDGEPLDPPAETVRKPYTMEGLAQKVRESLDQASRAEAAASRASGS